MKKFSPLIAALGLAAAIMPVTAGAAPRAPEWQSINARQERIDTRIDRGIRSGALTRAEAARLRGEFQGLARLEAQYRRSGGRLTVAERRELDRRFDALSARVNVQKHDPQHRR